MAFDGLDLASGRQGEPTLAIEASLTVASVEQQTDASTPGFSVIAIIAAYNEADVIAGAVGDLISQGVQVYLLDHGSTDDTADVVSPFLGRGLLRIERIPGDSAAESAADYFTWEELLRRKEALAASLSANWFIHADADEFRESPWPHLTLIEAIRVVDRLGYNAIDFALFNFWPTHDRFVSGADVRGAFPRFQPGELWDRIQIRCWKKTATPVDLASSGGHEARFPDRRVFPIRFVLRHYPLRGQTHGERKIFRERRPRFVATERARGWHVHYDRFCPGQSLLREEAELTPWDADAVRIGLALHHRGVEALEEIVGRLEIEVTEREATIRDLAMQLEAARDQAERDHRELETQRSSIAQLVARVDELLASKSWRLTAPLRALQDALQGGASARRSTKRRGGLLGPGGTPR